MANLDPKVKNLNLIQQKKIESEEGFKCKKREKTEKD